MKSIAFIIALMSFVLYANEKKATKELKKAAKKHQCPYFDGWYTKCDIVDTYIEWPEDYASEIKERFENDFLDWIKQNYESATYVGDYGIHLYPKLVNEMFQFQSSGNTVYTIQKNQQPVTAQIAPKLQSICERNPQNGKKQLSLISLLSGLNFKERKAEKTVGGGSPKVDSRLASI